MKVGIGRADASKPTNRIAVLSQWCNIMAAVVRAPGLAKNAELRPAIASWLHPQQITDKKIGSAAAAVGRCGRAVVRSRAPPASSKSLSAWMSALTTCIVEAGSTLCPSRPRSAAACPCSLGALVTLEFARVFRPDGPAHPLLVPPDLVHAVVVAAAVGDGHLVEIAVCQQPPRPRFARPPSRHRCLRG